MIYMYDCHGSPNPEKRRSDHDGNETDDNAHLPGRGGSDAAQAPRRGRAGIDGGTHTPGDRRISDAPSTRSEKGGAEMRGDGSVFLRGRIWWIAYSFRGKLYQESSKSPD